MKTGTRQRIGVFPDPRKNGIGNYMYVKYIYIVISIYILITCLQLEEGIQQKMCSVTPIW
jgi:hypothetical protein